MHTSFLSHEKGRYLWLSLTLVAACVAVYVIHDPLEPHNGGTIYGYGLGILGVLMILWLAYLGRRKRHFTSRFGTVRGWVSAHVYLGLALLVIATLHTGFQFGFNVHTLAYVLMCIVIVSGCVGVLCYRILPAERNTLKKGRSLDELFFKLEDLDGQLQRLAEHLTPDLRAAVLSALDRTTVGGSFTHQLLAADESTVLIEGRVVENVAQQTIIDAVLRRLSVVDEEASTRLSNLIRVLTDRRNLLEDIRGDIRLHGLLKLWLFVHVPFTFALLAALIAHVVSVFFYW
ncbi:MAG: hypothetical protein AAF525_07045 [Pseudomonadota bacterium]